MAFSDPSTWNDSIHRVIAAQALNLARIDVGEILNFPAATGGVTELIGPKPDVIRLYDTPNRIQASDKYADAGLIITIGPLADVPGGGRIVHRDDRLVEYMVTALISLNREEQEQDSEEMGTDSLLARRVDAFLHDFWSVFQENFNLKGDYCPQGLVDDHAYTIAWDPETQYPKTLLLFHCSAKLYRR
jgi:hypothetical protein